MVIARFGLKHCLILVIFRKFEKKRFNYKIFYNEMG